MNLPFSVLNTKKEKPIRLQEGRGEITEPKSISTDFDKQIEDVLSKGLRVIDESDIMFIRNHKSRFYRNSIAILLLTLNIKRDSSFVFNPQFTSYKEYISRGVINLDNEAEFTRKLYHEIMCYNQKIDMILYEISSTSSY